MTRSKTLVLVGCGAAKRDESAPARDLYTSTYFAKKREYAETIGDEWLILSAEHALVTPDRELDPYETSIDDLDEDRLDALAHTVGMSLIDWIANEVGKGVEIEEIIVLAGRSYLDPLREREAFSAGIDPTVTFPLQTNDLGGIGEQMGWLSERVAAESAEQTRLVTDGGTERRDPTEDPAACSMCGVYIGAFGDEYCDGCAREIGAKPPLERCLGCGQRAPQEQMESIDVSPEDEYYPDIRYLCRGCSGGEPDAG